MYIGRQGGQMLSAADYSSCDSHSTPSLRVGVPPAEDTVTIQTKIIRSAVFTLLSFGPRNRLNKQTSMEHTQT
jgi:hypothetical protein